MRCARRLEKLSQNGIARQRRKIGMVFQQFNLYPHMTVLQNIIEAPIGIHGESRKDAIANAMRLLERVAFRKRPRTIRGSFRADNSNALRLPRASHQAEADAVRRTDIRARPELVGEVLATMRDLAKQGLTMIVVTHEIGFAREAADRVVFMDGGHIIEMGKPEDVIGNPQHPRTQAFLSRFL